MVIAVAEKILPIDVCNLKRLGIDEISLVKGQGKFIVVLVDLSTHKLVGLVSSPTVSEIEKVMRQWGEKVLSQIIRSCIYSKKLIPNLLLCGNQRHENVHRLSSFTSLGCITDISSLHECSGS